MTRRQLVLLTAAAGTCLLLLAVWQTNRIALRHYLAAGSARAESALRLTVNALEGDLARYEVVPQLLADLDAIRQLMSFPEDPVRRAAIDLLLEDRADTLGASDIYIMTPDGDTIAASNHRRPDSFIGQNFNYRPYFQEAAAGGLGRFYGVGTTSGVRGYFFSAPVRDQAGQIAGVIAVKIGVDRIEASWRGNEYRTFVSDPEGIVFLSSDPRLVYGSLWPLTAERIARTELSRRYSDRPLDGLDLRQTVTEGTATAFITPDPGMTPIETIAVHQDMPEAGWTVHVLLDAAGARTEARVATVTALLLLCLAAFGAVVFWQRRARIAERMEMQTRAKADLERRVEERTADLERVNVHLEQEITERRATEAELRAAQASLVQVGKLAALGQMSASLSHEINQPLAAARNYADSAAILIERGDHARARENITEILALVDRMAAIGKHLRHAARKPDDRLGAVALAPLLRETQTIVAARLASSGARLELEIPADLPPLRAGPTRLQQVLVNLITNAADAVADQPDRRITLSARTEGPRVAICVRDRGPGVPDAIAARIFDPFFTTKGIGAGLGLGLSITANIVRDFGGEITCHDARPGAEFRVTLPAAADDEIAA